MCEFIQTACTQETWVFVCLFRFIAYCSQQNRFPFAFFFRKPPKNTSVLRGAGKASPCSALMADKNKNMREMKDDHARRMTRRCSVEYGLCLPR